MQDHAAHQLHVEVALAQGALGRLAHVGEGVGQDVVERLAVGQALLQRRVSRWRSSSSVSAWQLGSSALTCSTCGRRP